MGKKKFGKRKTIFREKFFNRKWMSIFTYDDIS